VSDIDTAVVDGLKALDPKWPIREADIVRTVVKCAAATSSRLACRRRPAQQVRQLGYVRHDVPGRHRSHGALTCAKLGALCAWKG